MKHAFIFVAAAGVLPGALAACKCPNAGETLPCARMGSATAVVKASITAKVDQGANQQFTLKVRLPLKGSLTVGSTITATTPKETFSCNVTNLLVGQTALFTLNGASDAYTFDDCGINQPWGSVTDTLRRSLTRIGSQATDCTKGGKPCTFNGQTVADGWRGNNTGVNSCNVCNCKNGFLRCEEKRCDGSEPPPLTPAMVGEVILRNLLKKPTKLVQGSVPSNKTAESAPSAPATVNATIEEIKKVLGVGTDPAINQTDVQNIVDKIVEAAPPLPEVDSPAVQINVSTEVPSLPPIAELLPPEAVKEIAEEIQSVLAPVEPPPIAPIPTQGTLELAVPEVKPIEVPKLVEATPVPTISLPPLGAPTATGTAGSKTPEAILPPPPIAPTLSAPVDLGKVVDVAIESAAPSSVLALPEPTAVDEELDSLTESIQNEIESSLQIAEKPAIVDVPVLNIDDSHVPATLDVPEIDIAEALPAPQPEAVEGVEAPELTAPTVDTHKVAVLNQEAEQILSHIEGAVAVEEQEAISKLVDTASEAVADVASVGQIDVPTLVAEPTAPPALLAPTPVTLEAVDVAAPVASSVDLAVPTHFEQVLLAHESEALAVLEQQEEAAQQQELQGALATLNKDIQAVQNDALAVEKVPAALEVPTLAPEPTAPPSVLVVPTADVAIEAPKFTDAPLAVENIVLPSPLAAAIDAEVQKVDEAEVGVAAADARAALASATVEAPQLVSDQAAPTLAVAIQPLAPPPSDSTAGVVVPNITAAPVPTSL